MLHIRQPLSTAPDDAAVRQQLERVLASSTFQQAARLKRFLRFIVEETLDSRAGELKEYVVAVQVFEKEDSFDPRTDPLVRVQARRLRARLTTGGSLEVVDVLRVQLDNLARKLRGDPRVGLIQGDSSALDIAAETYDRALLFFLLHEQPEDVRRRTIAEALRVVKPGGRLVIVDYHQPLATNPLYWPMVAILKTLEPFAMDLWRSPIADWLPAGVVAEMRKETAFGGLYQRVTITKR